MADAVDYICFHLQMVLGPFIRVSAINVYLIYVGGDECL